MLFWITKMLSGIIKLPKAFLKQLLSYVTPRVCGTDDIASNLLVDKQQQIAINIVRR